jgi:sugar O-acyltransferase (sialic acid O-acetyltransferase NeuD family)
MPAAPEGVLIYGAGGFGREIAWLADTATSRKTVVAFVDDQPTGTTPSIRGVPVLSFDDATARYPGAGIVVAVGAPSARRRLAERAIAAGLVPTTLVHSGVAMSPFVEIGAGSVVCAGCILTTDIRLGRQVQINLDCTIGHDVVIEDYATLAPGVHVSGYVHLSAGCYVGTGACIINGTSDEPLQIGADSVVGAGAVVTRAVVAGTTVVGVPARAR